MLWVDVLRELHALRSAPGRGGLNVTGVQYDSRAVRPGDVFVAMRGETVDGNRFVPQAVAAGAAAVITDAEAIWATCTVDKAALGCALVAHGRRALSEASAAVFGHPERALALSAVTGTNGKTTTAWVLEQLLRAAGRRAVLVGTIETHVAGDVRASPHTTPESRDLLETFAEGRQAGCTEAVIEASSHALDQERTWGLPVDVAIWTNLTQDHLDYHGTMESYFAAKAKLFQGLGTPPPRVAVINADDTAGQQMLSKGELRSEIRTYGLDQGEYRAVDIELHAGCTRFSLQSPRGELPVQSPLTGRVNVYNLLAALCAAEARGIPLEQAADATKTLQQVPGRFELVPAGASGITAVVDYAHTDDALRNLLFLGRELIRERGGRVIIVFGCGGDRDRSKRVKMGRVAGEGSDFVVVTSDNPRSEDPMRILGEVVVGVRETGVSYAVEEDRAAAIAIALRAAAPGDLVLIAGKGHERVQILRDRTVPFDDVAVAADLLRRRA